MTSLLVYLKCKTIKNVLEKTNRKFLMAKRRKLLSESKSECNKTLEKGHYKTSRNKYEKERKLLKCVNNIQTLNYAYMHNLETIFGTQLAT